MLVYRIVMGLSSCCVVCVVSAYSVFPHSFIPFLSCRKVYEIIIMNESICIMPLADNLMRNAISMRYHVEEWCIVYMWLRMLLFSTRENTLIIFFLSEGRI
jgi:hypothetical protein